ncbi:hypothetical protein Tco_1539650 [Tanacetum coccineum]
MASTRASIFKASKRPKINIIPPKQLFVDLTYDDTKTPSLEHQISSPSALNAPSKTPSTKGTSSSSIDYTPKSPTSSTSPSTNGYLNSPTSPPPRVPSPPPNQENTLMTIPPNKPFTNLLPLHSEVVKRSEVVKQSKVVKRRDVVKGRNLLQNLDILGVLQDVAADLTLSCTKAVRCAQCGHEEVASF